MCAYLQALGGHFTGGGGGGGGGAQQNKQMVNLKYFATNPCFLSSTPVVKLPKRKVVFTVVHWPSNQQTAKVLYSHSNYYQHLFSQLHTGKITNKLQKLCTHIVATISTCFLSYICQVTNSKSFVLTQQLLSALVFSVTTYTLAK